MPRCDNVRVYYVELRQYVPWTGTLAVKARNGDEARKIARDFLASDMDQEIEANDVMWWDGGGPPSRTRPTVYRARLARDGETYGVTREQVEAHSQGGASDA